MVARSPLRIAAAIRVGFRWVSESMVVLLERLVSSSRSSGPC